MLKADTDLKTRIKVVREHITLIMLLSAAAGVGLARYGINWATFSAIIPAVIVALVVFSWLRVRLFPTWRLLELCLYPGKWFGAVLALFVDLLPSMWWSRRFGLRVYVVARLRIEAGLIAQGEDEPDDATNGARWRHHFRAMIADDRRLAAVGRRGRGADDLGVPFTIEIPDCLPLTEKDMYASIDRYFEALRSTGHPTDRFLAELHVKSAFVAPLYLLTGQLAHFDDSWRQIVQAYARVISIDDPIAHEGLRNLRAFQFACWIVWGPSVPVCTCQYWSDGKKNAVGFQLGYGDENTSIVVYDESPMLRRSLARARRRAADVPPSKEAQASAPLAIEVEATVLVRRPGAVTPDRLCHAQASLIAPDAERLIVEHRHLARVTGSRGGYYSAYMWVMFVLESEPGQLIAPKDERWRALLPFFVHGNVADAPTYAFLKQRLAHEALDAIEALVSGADAAAGVTFVYMSAIDDPGCGKPALVVDPGEQIKRTLQHLLKGRFAGIGGRVRVADDSAHLRTEDGDYYAKLFSTCHLPDTIDAYFKCLGHLERGQPHGADAA